MTEEINRRYQCFNKQVDAFELQKKGKNKRCFSVEYPFLTNSGMALRRFIIDDLMGFWIWYRNQYSGPKHFYEIIQEGYPCRLYFDLEYQKEENKHIVLNTVLNDFINLVNGMVDEHYRLRITKKNWLILGSSTDTKFSAHATVHFPGNYVFPNNVAMRIFIQAITQRMSDTGIGIVNKGSEETFLCDPAVYTKNRCFRLYLSSKAGKTAYLDYMKGCQFYDVLPKDDLQIFLDSLVIPPDFEKCPKLNIQENPHLVMKQRRMNGSNKTKVISSFVPKRNPIPDMYKPEDCMEVIQISSGISPLEELDKYVVDFNQNLVPDIGQIVIRQWTYFVVKNSGSRRIQYQFVNCRYCFHMGRQHKSQNVYWTVQLEDFFMFQRCFDCRDFVSNYFPLPADLIEKIKPKIDAAFKNKLDTEAMTKEDRKNYRESLDNTFFSLNMDEASMYVNVDDNDSDIEIIEPKVMDSFNDTSIERQVLENKKKIEDSFYNSSIERAAAESMASKKKEQAVQTPKIKKIDIKKKMILDKNQSSIMDFSRPILKKNNALIDLTQEIEKSTSQRKRKIPLDTIVADSRKKKTLK